jgi:hypothetical protein
MKRLYFGTCLLILSFISCGRKTAPPPSPPLSDLDPIENTEILTRDSFPAVDIKPELEEVPLYLVAEIKRTPCYGECPVYQARIFSDGRAEYEGISHVTKIGKFKTTIPTKRLQEIYQAAENANYFVFGANYPTNGRFIGDLPITSTYLKRGGLEKRIKNNFDAPLALQAFENWLELFFMSLNWTLVVE